MVSQQSWMTLPKEYLTEKDSVWILGSHMSLGESRRSKKAYVVEGTFHMLKILKQTEGAISFGKLAGSTNQF